MAEPTQRTDKPKLKVKMQSVSDVDVRKRLWVLGHEYSIALLFGDVIFRFPNTISIKLKSAPST